MGISSSHIQGMWGVIGAIIAALVTGGLGLLAGRSWEANMAEKIYNDNKAFLQRQIDTLTKEKNEFKRNIVVLENDFQKLQNNYAALQKEYEYIMGNYQQLQKKLNNQADNFVPSEVRIIPPSPTDSFTKQDGGQLPLMQVAAPYDFFRGEIYIQGKTFTMAGVKYTDGFTLKGGGSGAYALINLEKQYSTLSFYVGHIDKTSAHRDATLHIIADGNIIHEEKIKNSLTPQKIDVELNHVSGLKIFLDRGSGEYGFANLFLKE